MGWVTIIPDLGGNPFGSGFAGSRQETGVGPRSDQPYEPAAPADKLAITGPDSFELRSGFEMLIEKRQSDLPGCVFAQFFKASKTAQNFTYFNILECPMGCPIVRWATCQKRS
jgi:hypothetical protein